MGLAIFAIVFYSVYPLFLVGLLISALFAKDKKKRKSKLIILSILTLPLLQFIAGKSAYEFKFKRQAGFHFQQNHPPLSFQKTRSYLIESLEKGDIFPFEILHELKLGSSDFIEFSERSMNKFNTSFELDLPQSKYYRVSSLTDDNCFWETTLRMGDRSKHFNPQNIKKCFKFEPVDSPESGYGFKTEVNNSIYFLPIIRARTILFETNLQKEVGRLDTYQFYYFYGAVFGGSQYPYTGGSLEFFYKKLQRPWDYHLYSIL